MRQFKMLVLTDHSGHSMENALYDFAKEMTQHPYCAKMDVATRGNPQNDSFFKDFSTDKLIVRPVNRGFKFKEDGQTFEQNKKKASVKNYDVVWLRMPPPLPKDFLKFLSDTFPDQLFINNPYGIWETGSKQFLLSFPDLCPPMKICASIDDILSFKQQFPIVLKPLREYGGKGIAKIDGKRAWLGKEEMPLEQFIKQIEGNNIEYLAVKYLKNVSKGDKRLVVIDGKIMGASLRLPPEDSWICNVAMGGSSNFADADTDEERMVKRLHPALAERGILMYGIDTLVNDEGQRVLSEINTTSIGGLPQIARQTGKPLLEEASQLIWNYIAKKTKTQNVAGNE